MVEETIRKVFLLFVLLTFLLIVVLQQQYGGKQIKTLFNLCKSNGTYNGADNITDKSLETFYKHFLIYSGSNKEIESNFNYKIGLIAKYTDPENITLMKRLPSVIGIGAFKCGTGALYQFLSHHPSLSMCRKSEVHYLNTERSEVDYQILLRNMRYSTVDQIPYLNTQGFDYLPSVFNINRYNKDIKLVLILKDPVHRIISIYLHSVAYKRTDGKNFIEWLFKENGEINENFEPLKSCLYHPVFSKWLQSFQRKQIHIIDGSEMILNPASELTKLEKFLNISPFFKPDQFVYNGEKGYFSFCLETKKCSPLSSRKGRTNPKKLEDTLKDIVFPDTNTTEVIEILKDYFSPHMERFYEMAQTRFKWIS